MSFHVISDVLKKRIGSTAAKMVMLKLASHAQDDGSRVYPSIATIAAEAEMSERQVQRILADLCERKLLVLEDRGGGRNRTSRYRIDLAALKLLPDARSVTEIRALSPERRNGDTMSPIAERVTSTTKTVTSTNGNGDTMSPEPVIEHVTEPLREGDLFEAALPLKKAKQAKAVEPVILKLPFVSYTQSRLDHLKNTCPGIDVEAELRSLTLWMDDQYRAGKQFDDPYGFVLRCLRKKSKTSAVPKPPPKPNGLIRLGDEPAKPNSHPLPFTPFRVIDDMPPNTREGAAVMERLKVAGLFDDYNICWTAKAERHRGKWVNPA